MITRSPSDDGDLSPLSSPPALRPIGSESGLSFPKNKSADKLSIHTGNNDSDSSLRKFSVDASSSEYDHMARSSLLDTEPGLGLSGLHRIRQQPPSRILTLPNTPSSSVILPSQPQSDSAPQSAASSRANSRANSRATSIYVPSESVPPALEDLHRFPSESLHSFSFAQQSEELLHSRQNILKRSIDFMRDRFGWAASNAGIASAQARINGDTELQTVMDLLSKARILDKDGDETSRVVLSPGPLTGPADVDGDNIFERGFAKHSPPFRLPEHGPEFDGIDEEPLQSPTSEDSFSQHGVGQRWSPSSKRAGLKRTYTDLSSLSLQSRLMETLAQPYSIADSVAQQLLMPTPISALGPSANSVHAHSSKWSPVAQAVFRTDAKSPWTIIAANDLACLVFGVTQAEVRKLSILEVVQKERRHWLESKLRDPSTDSTAKCQSSTDKARPGPINPRSMGMGNGVTAQLLSRPSSRQKDARRAQTDDGSGSSFSRTKYGRKANHAASKSRGVLLCGDVVPIRKRNGDLGSATFWVMEKRGGLIWVLEEITESTAHLKFDERMNLVEGRGDLDDIWGQGMVRPGLPITELLPNMPKDWAANSPKDPADKVEIGHFTASNVNGINIPANVFQMNEPRYIRVSSFPHVAGMMVLSASSLKVISSNSVFSAALFGYEYPEGLQITDLIPNFDDFLHILTEEDKVPLVDGIVVPEHSFRKARALSVLRDGKATAASLFLRPTGLPAKHHDGSDITVDVQMRVVKSETFFPDREDTLAEEGQGDEGDRRPSIAVTEVVYALWVTYSRQLHSVNQATLPSPKEVPARADTPASRLSSGQMNRASPLETPNETSRTGSPSMESKSQQMSLLSQQLNEAASEPLSDLPVQPIPEVQRGPIKKEVHKKKTISDYVILEEMGQGAYGQVKLARNKATSTRVVLKYVTKRRILVDTWTRDRRLGTVPLEIHVLDFLRRDGLKHPNIVEMEGFFEDDINYYIEMVPHGLPGMDLFDYIELKSNMDEMECRNIFRQVIDAIHHLHTKALVVHRDIKDENVVLDGEGRIKLIDFGSAAYIKNGPFDVFVGTIDYAAPEVLQGKSYRGKEQDVWALGILLYTIVYKENPFYNIDEILDHPLRIPFLPFSEDCIDLIRKMLDRDVDERLTITEVMEHPWMGMI